MEYKDSEVLCKEIIRLKGKIKAQKLVLEYVDRIEKENTKLKEVNDQLWRQLDKLKKEQDEKNANEFKIACENLF
jgi:predicted nuclease with TOPRIM domain